MPKTLVNVRKSSYKIGNFCKECQALDESPTFIFQAHVCPSCGLRKGRVNKVYRDVTTTVTKYSKTPWWIFWRKFNSNVELKFSIEFKTEWLKHE